MASPKAKFFSTLDLLCCLAEQVKNTKSLWSLCLVNRVFNDAFTPALYAELRFNHYAPDEEQRHINELASSSRHLKHTKLLSLHRGRDIGRDEYYDHLAFFNDQLRKLLAQAPLLETFECIASLLESHTLIWLRERCQRIKNLVIFHPHFVDTHDWVWTTAVYLSLPSDYPAFHNLQALFLDGIYGMYTGSDWMSALVETLRTSPGLQELSLSIASDAIMRNARDDQFACKNFLRSLCDLYAESGAQPLRLRALHLGLGLVLWAEDRTVEMDNMISPLTLALFDQPRFVGYPATYLSKLTTLEYLEEAHVENDDAFDMGGDGVLGLKNGWGVEWLNSRDGLAWGTFLPEWTPNLRRLTWTNTTDSVVEFLSGLDKKYAAGLALAHFIDDQCDEEPEISDGSYSEEPDMFKEDDALGVTFHGSGDEQEASGADEDDETDDPNALPGPYGYYAIRQIKELGAPAKSPGLGFRMIRVSVEWENEQTGRTPQRIMEDLVAAQAMSLEGLAIHFGRTIDKSILGPYLACLPKLSQLIVAHENEVDWDTEEQLTETILEKVERRRFVLMEEVAMDLVRHSNSLRFVKVGNVGWEIIRTADGRECRLVELDVNEEERIELFRHRRRMLGSSKSSYMTMA